MRRRLGAAAIAAVVVTAPTAAHAEPTIRDKTVDKFGRKQVQKYAHFHRKWTHRSGKNVVGRQIVKHGMPRKGRDRVASRREWRRTLRVFHRWEHPPKPPAPPPTLSSTSPSVGSAYSSGTGQYAIPTDIVMCESNGDYGAYNSSSAAGGAYQILPSTWEAYGGTGSPHTASPAEQDAVAARIWNGGAGRSQWAC